MDEPAYAGGEPLEIPFEEDHPGWRDITVIYDVTIRAAANGHACVNLSHVDMASRRVLVENLMCQSLVRPTRISILRAMLFAVSEALLDAERQG